ncbi:unnamed protein product [Cuscuta europaea]|uniref:Uncharacterized protein n=1 Tax=Cuscuta europaea TaxID=41803 RepID=A0A9P0YWX9_CUSEU|nr:unnamed protein product [Cuscuta europaea]
MSIHPNTFLITTYFFPNIFPLLSKGFDFSTLPIHSNLIFTLKASSKASSLTPMADSSSDVPPKQRTNNPSKYCFFYKHLMLKPLVVSVFLVFLLLFPSQAPEFLTQTLSTKIWEVLQLILVGIAVSYGLFSRKTDGTIKENDGSTTRTTNFDNANSYVSGLLQVSSVFDNDDESEGPCVFFDEKIDSSNNVIYQSWRNQYYMEKPRVVVAPEEQRDDFSVDHYKNSRIGEKPLLLPVRSLKSSRIEEAEEEEEEPMEETNWRSRSAGRRTMEDPEIIKQDPTPVRSVRTQSFKRSPSPSPDKHRSSSPAAGSPPPSVRMTLPDGEEIGRKHNKTNSPPLPRSIGKSSSMKLSSTEQKSEEPRRRSYSGREMAGGDGRRRRRRRNQENFVKKEDEEEEFSGREESEEDENGGVGENSNSGDVDKKADEFIAKFREQIRLQRVDSFRRSAPAGHGSP